MRTSGINKRAYSVQNVLDAKFTTLSFEGEWKSACGFPELTGSWFVYGAPKNGKTSFTMKLSKYLCRFCRVGYNSVEEGLSKSIRDAFVRHNMLEVARRFTLIDKEGVEELMERLKKRKSPDVIVIDTVQFMELTFVEYKKLKTTFPNKLFIYVSHVDGRKPAGSVANKIWRDANISFRIEGFKAFPIGRYGGGEPLTIWPERAMEYWSIT